MYVEGLKELQAALMQLKRATAKNVMTRVLKKAGEPVRAAAQSIAPVATKPNKHHKIGRIRDRMSIGTTLTNNQKKVSKRLSAVEVYIGDSGVLPEGIFEEFGTAKNTPHPFLRPAWEQHKMEVLQSIKKDTWAEIEKTAKRVAARAAAKG